MSLTDETSADATPYRRAWLSPDYRRDPKTELFCVRCQKPLKSGAHRWAHIINGGMWVLHPEDEALYDDPAGDLLWHPIGNDCARQVGVEFTVADREFVS